MVCPMAILACVRDSMPEQDHVNFLPLALLSIVTLESRILYPSSSGASRSSTAVMISMLRFSGDATDSSTAWP